MSNTETTGTLSWTWRSEDIAESSGGSCHYMIIRTCADGPDRYPWLLLPPYNAEKHVTHHTNAYRAMEAAELRETDPDFFLATVAGPEAFKALMAGLERSQHQPQSWGEAQS
jgi:hypothetical protein